MGGYDIEAMREHREFRATFYEAHKVALAPFFEAAADYQRGGSRGVFLCVSEDARRRWPELTAGITRYAAGCVSEPEPDFI